MSEMRTIKQFLSTAGHNDKAHIPAIASSKLTQDQRDWRLLGRLGTMNTDMKKCGSGGLICAQCNDVKRKQKITEIGISISSTRKSQQSCPHQQKLAQLSSKNILAHSFLSGRLLGVLPSQVFDLHPTKRRILGVHQAEDSMALDPRVVGQRNIGIRPVNVAAEDMVEPDPRKSGIDIDLVRWAETESMVLGHGSSEAARIDSSVPVLAR